MPPIRDLNQFVRQIGGRTGVPRATQSDWWTHQRTPWRIFAVGTDGGSDSSTVRRASDQRPHAYKFSAASPLVSLGVI